MITKYPYLTIQDQPRMKSVDFGYVTLLKLVLIARIRLAC
jgi:hypothetical protein